MRLIDFGDKEDYQPLERGTAFPQFYEDGDRYDPHHPMLWHHRFWYEMRANRLLNEPEKMYLMGGEL